MIVSLIMGMGVPTTAAYLVLAALVAPTLVNLGIPVIAAHNFINLLQHSLDVGKLVP